jgi:hypothetical protein
MSRAKRSAITATAAEIVKYWSQRESECGLSVDWAEAHERCWRCSRKGRLEKCHIVPHALGGTNSAENLVLLCARCHREATNVSDPSFIWIWLRRYAISFYDTDWIIRGCEEFERIFRRKPFAGLTVNVSENKIIEALKAYRQKAIIHFVEGRPNPSTVAWLFSKIETELTSRGVSNK